MPYDDLSNQELEEKILKDAPSMTESEVDEIQVEWCKRHRAKYLKPDGTVVYEPPDWPGP